MKDSRLFRFLRDPNVSIKERMFLLFTMMTEIPLILAFIGDLIIKEHSMELITLALAALLNPPLVYWCMKKHKVDIGAKIISIFVIFVVMPTVFFFGGGPDGGAVLWFTYSAIYIGLLLSGKMRTVMLTLLFSTATVDFILAWTNPILVRPHTKAAYYVDSLVSVLAVGIFAFVMVMFQSELFVAENKRAKEESERAEQLNAAQNQFFSNMSHEIRTPINTILGLNEMILKEEVNAEVKEDAKNIQSAGKLLLTIINDILDKSKLESGQMRLVDEEYHIANTIKEVVSMLAPRATEKHLEFDVDVSPDVPSGLIGDEIRIRQILINVINNAIKYTKDGKVSFSVRSGAQKENEIMLVFTIRDTGIGIKKESLPYLFTAFKRVDGEETHHIEGTGLGLSIVKELLDLMGGKITVDSVYTKGSVFMIEIPQRISNETGIGEIGAYEMEESVEDESNRIRFEAPEARLLVVDDNTTNLMVTEKLLRDTKVIIDSVESGKAALMKTLEREYHLILMDHLMPEMDGVECAKRIREQKGGLNKETKIVALTANASAEHRELFAQSGFDGYLTKPVSGEALETEVARLLPKELVIISRQGGDIMKDTVQWMSSSGRKRHVTITTESVCDLPDELIEKYGIKVVPHKVITNEGRFRDGLEIESNGLLSYIMETGCIIDTEEPDAPEHEEFFAEALVHSDTIVHIALSDAVAHSGYPDAVEAAASFDNVYVVDSRHLSSGQGLLVLEACRMAENGMKAEKIVKEIQKLIPKIHTSFIVDNLDFLSNAGQVSKNVAHLLNSLTAKPVLVMRNGKMGVGKFYFGSREHSWEAYISTEMSKMKRAQKDTLFITYAGMPMEELLRIKSMIEEKIAFEHIYIVQASPAISANSGPFTFGLLYREE